MEAPNLKEIEQRPLRHWLVDGLPELLMGVLLLAWGGLWLIRDALPAGTLRRIFWSVGPLVLVALLFACKWLLFRLKEQITYPRAGYVKARHRGRRAAWAAVAGSLVAALVGFGSRSPDARRLFPLIFGVILAGGFLWMARRLRAPYLLLYALVPLLFQAYYYWADEGIMSLEWMLVILGAMCATAGAVRLRRFVRQNPKQVETDA
jgi:hypothetical protein